MNSGVITVVNVFQDDANANEALCGAVGMVGGCEGEGVEASAVIEGPEGDMIAVDTPEQPTTDIPALFQVSHYCFIHYHHLEE